MSSMTEMSSWYGKRLPDRYSESIEKIFSGSRVPGSVSIPLASGTVSRSSKFSRTSWALSVPWSDSLIGAPPCGRAQAAVALRDRGQLVDRVLEVAVEQRLDALERVLLGYARDVVGAGERHLGHRRRLGGERGEILRLEAVNVRLPARAREHLHLERERVEEVVDAVRRLLHMQPLAQLRVLGRDADRAATRVAVVALARWHADRALVVRDTRNLLVAVERHQGGVADRDGVGAEGDALGHVAAVADAAGHDEVDLVSEAHVLKRAARLRDRRHQRDAGLLGRGVRAGAGAALGPVEVDDVRAALGGHAHVVVHARGAQLQLDRDLVVGGLSGLLDLEAEVIGAEPVGVAGRASLVDPGGKGAHLGNLLGHLLAHQVATEAHLAALSDEELDGVGQHQVVRVEPVPALDDLVVPLGAEVALGRDHSALAGARSRARHGRPLRQCHLRLERQRAEAHSRDVDRDVELDRLLREARAEHRLRHTLFAIALDHEARKRAWQEDQLVPVRDLLEHREAAHPVATELGLHVDVVDDLRGEDLAAAEDGLLAGCVLVGHLEHQLPLARLELVVVVELLAANELLELGRLAEAVDPELALDQLRVRLGPVAGHTVDPQRLDLAGDVDRAVVHRVAEARADVAADDLAAALHHEAGH